MYHVTTATMTDDGKFSAKGLGFEGDRPCKVVRCRLSLTYSPNNGTTPGQSCSMSAGLFSPIHSEAMTWSRTHLVNTFTKTNIVLRSPPGQDWGHYDADDAVVIVTLRGRDENYAVWAVLEAWVAYGPPTKPVASRLQANLLPDVTYVHDVTPAPSIIEVTREHLRDLDLGE